MKFKQYLLFWVNYLNLFIQEQMPDAAELSSPSIIQRSIWQSCKRHPLRIGVHGKAHDDSYWFGGRCAALNKPQRSLTIE
jgi:hypothetical protein